MPSIATRNRPWAQALLSLGLLALGLGSSLASAHPKGFHKKLTITLTAAKLSALIVMDVDAGDRCLMLREAVDSNRDGLLSGAEVTVLKKRLVKLATGALKLSLSSAPLPLSVTQSKLSLREDRRANDSPLSVAVLVELALPHSVGEGASLEIEDTSPDRSPLVLEVFQAGAQEPPFQKEVESGRTTRIRLGDLHD